MTFSTQHSTLADVSASARPQRERNDEALEVERRNRYDRGICRDCNRKRRPTGKLCTLCRRRIERNTERDPGKQARKGRMSIADSDASDLKLAVQAICAGAAQLGAVSGALTKFERQRVELEPLSQLLLGVKSAFEVAKRRGCVAEWLEAIRLSLARE